MTERGYVSITIAAQYAANIMCSETFSQRLSAIPTINIAAAANVDRNMRGGASSDQSSASTASRTGTATR